MSILHTSSWHDYLNDLPDGELKYGLNQAFAEAEYFIACISNYYRLQISVPTIVIYESKDNKSGICYENKAIVIYEGLLLYLFINEKREIQETLETRVNHFLWITAHEYFHYARRHNEVKNVIANKFKSGGITEVDKKIYAQVLEDDADRLATAALYRHFTYYKYKENNSLENKLVVLGSLFEPIRLKISGVVENNSTNNTHPVWSMRLYSQVIKLSELDTRNPNIRLTKDSKTIIQQGLLQERLLKLEAAYLHVRDEPEKNLLYQYSVGNNRFIDLHKLNIYSEKIYQLIYKKCCLPGLNGQTRKWMPKAVQDEAEFKKISNSVLSFYLFSSHVAK